MVSRGLVVFRNGVVGSWLAHSEVVGLISSRRASRIHLNSGRLAAVPELTVIRHDISLPMV